MPDASRPLAAWTCQTPGVPCRVSPRHRRMTLDDPARYERVLELMRAAPEPRVLAWLDAQPAADVWTTAVTVGVIRLGIALLPDGRRKERLVGLAEAWIEPSPGA